MAQITLKGQPLNTSGDLPPIGTQAPDFSVVKPDLSKISLSDLKGRRVLLNIFPSVDTGTCALSVRKFNEQAANLNNTVVVCISKDLPFAHARFCGAEGIENVISTSSFRDGGVFARAYGVEITEGPMRDLNARAVVVLDEEGKVIYTELVSELVNEPDYEEAVAAL